MHDKSYIDEILTFLADRLGRPAKPRKLARQMGVPDDEYGAFRRAYKELKKSGRLMLGSTSALTLPVLATTVIGRFQKNPRGFGFVVPDQPRVGGDLFVPPDRTAGAMTGDLVVARVLDRGRRQGSRTTAGEVIEIRERGLKRCVGTLERADGAWLVVPDGRNPVGPVLVRDVPDPARAAGSKVVVEIVEFSRTEDPPVGVIVETLGRAGQPRTELKAVMRAHGLADRFPEQALAEARRAASGFASDEADDREDLTSLTIVTIDPETARDFDDAISLEDNADGTVTLGVHIADVAHFVPEGSALDAEARRRGTSVYFPRQVVPMLPEVLSNGVCSLQEGVRRLAKSVFITYDQKGTVLEREAAATVIRSTKRLTYAEAQAICDGQRAGYPPEVVRLVREMERLARMIEARRAKAGMLGLDLPEIELVLDDAGRVVDGAPGDASYTHKIIELFMVEANEAIAGGFAVLKVPIIRRIHPAPDDDAFGQLTTFVRACGHNLARRPNRKDIQRLTERVRGRPEAYAVNLALLRSFEQAIYSFEADEHYALASSHYCHFTSPIRRYPDLVVHRELDRYLRNAPSATARLDQRARRDLADELSAAERNAAAAEAELKLVLVLQHLAQRIGDEIEGVLTGVAEFGVFVQWPRLGVEGLVRLPDLGDDWWDVSASEGTVRGQVSGAKLRIGDPIRVRITAVDVARRHLDLVAADRLAGPARRKQQPKRKSAPVRKRSRRRPRRRP
jgi:ribonuclease R